MTTKRWLLMWGLILPLAGCQDLDLAPLLAPESPNMPGAAAATTIDAAAYLEVEAHEVSLDTAMPKATASEGWHFSDDGREAWRLAGEGSDVSVTFTPRLPADGDYEVRVWVPAGLGDAKSATYRVRAGGEEHWRWIDQLAKQGTWVTLGTFPHAEDRPLSLLQPISGHEAVPGTTRIAVGPVKFARIKPQREAPADTASMLELASSGRKVRWETNRRRTAVQLVARKDGFGVAYTDDKGVLVVATLDAQGRAQGETSLADRELMGFAAAADGTLGVLAQETQGDAPAVSVVRLDAALGKLGETRLLGGEGRGPGASFAAGYFGNGRLIAAGDRLAAYFEHSRNWAEPGAAEDVHQGDDLVVLNAEGEVAEQEAWLVSHGLDQRLAWDGRQIHMLSLGDCYPKGIVYRSHPGPKGTVVFPDEGLRDAFADCAGRVEGELGGLVALDDGAIFTFTASQGRDGMDVGLIRLGPDGGVRRLVWLTRTPGLTEDRPKLVRLADGRLVALWRAGGIRSFAAVLDAEGQVSQGPVAIAPTLGHGDDPIVTSSGEIAWAYAEEEGAKLVLARYRP